MADVALQGAMQADSTNIGEIWKRALERFSQDVSTDVQNLAEAHSVSDILHEIENREESFAHRRHSGSKADKLRSAISSSLEPVEALCKQVSSATSNVRPLPSRARGR